MIGNGGIIPVIVPGGYFEGVGQGGILPGIGQMGYCQRNVRVEYCHGYSILQNLSEFVFIFEVVFVF